MTTATAEAPSTQTLEQAREVAKSNPELALEAVIAETEKLKIAHEREQRDAKTLAEVKFGPGGLECDNLAALWRVGQMLSRSDMVPEQYRGKPENCLIALQMAQRCKVDVFMFMQNTYIVHGRPGIEAKLAIAMLNMSGNIEGRMKFEMTGRGPAQECTASVFDKESGEQISMKVDWKMVEAEGWNKKSGSKWNTMPEIMFRYRSAMFLIRTHYPEVLLGMQTVDELEDVLDLPDKAAQAAEPHTGNGSAQDRIAAQLGVNDEYDAMAESKPESKPPENQPASAGDSTTAGEETAQEPPAETDTESEPAMDQPPADWQPSDAGSGLTTKRGEEIMERIESCDAELNALLNVKSEVIAAKNSRDYDVLLQRVEQRIAEVKSK